MQGEDLDIGLYAVDAYAGHVAEVATHLHIIPEFRNARGATLDVLFTGPFIQQHEFQKGYTKDSSYPSAMSRSLKDIFVGEAERAVRTVSLHGWMEKLNAARKVQLMEPVIPLGDESNSPEECLGGTDAPSQFRILGSLDFLLHLSSRDLMTGESATDLYFSFPSGDAKDISEADSSESATRAAHAFRDALEQRDDVSLARNAVDTVIKFAQMVKEHPNEEAIVRVDAQTHVEYIHFEER